MILIPKVLSSYLKLLSYFLSINIPIFAVFVADYINRYYFMVLPPVGFVGNILSFLVSFRFYKSILLTSFGIFSQLGARRREVETRLI